MRVKRGIVARRRRKKVFDRASGFYSSGSRVYNVAKNMSDRALVYGYRDRKVKKRDFRGLWIQRINAAARINGLSYSQFIGGLKKAGIDLNRKALADMAIFDAEGFKALADQVRA